MNQRGIALVSAIMMGLILLLVAIGIASHIETGGRMFSQLRAKDEALNVAEAGLEWAVNRFDPDDSGAVAVSAPFGKGEYEISKPTVLSNNERYLIKVVAHIPTKAKPLYSRAIQAIVEVSPAPVFDYAMAAGGNVDLAGNITVNSSPAPHQGNVHANGDIISSGGSLTVDGNTTAHGTNTLGGRSNAPCIEIPGVSDAKIDSFYHQALNLGSHTFGAFDGSTLQGYYSPAASWEPKTPSHTSFALNGNLDIPANGIVFIDGDLDLSGSTNIEGSGTLIVNGKVSITGSVKLGQHGDLSIVSLDASSEAITVKGNVVVGGLMPSSGVSSSDSMPSAILFAPNGGIDVSGNPSIYGSLIAGANGDVKGSATITRVSERTSGIVGFGDWKAIDWREVKP